MSELVQSCSGLLLERGEFLATAESCTGGAIAAACTDLSGSSAWFERGFVTYSNQAKTDCLAVPADVIEAYGAVSEPVIRAMANGVLQHSAAQWGIATSGIAGPTGGTADKPVGTVWVAWAGPQKLCDAQVHHFSGDRASVRSQTVQAAFQGLLERLEKASLRQ